MLKSLHENATINVLMLCTLKLQKLNYYASVVREEMYFLLDYINYFNLNALSLNYTYI